MRDRVAIVALALVLLAVFAWRWIWRLWGAIVTGWGDRVATFEWLDSAMLMLWLFLFALCLLLGFLLSVFGRPARPLIVSAVTGLCLGALLMLGARNHFTEHATLSTYVWAYGLYAMAPLGALAGALLSLGLGRLARRQAAV